MDHLLLLLLLVLSIFTSFHMQIERQQNNNDIHTSITQLASFPLLSLLLRSFLLFVLHFFTLLLLLLPAIFYRRPFTVETRVFGYPSVAPSPQILLGSYLAAVFSRVQLYKRRRRDDDQKRMKIAKNRPIQARRELPGHLPLVSKEWC